MSAFQYLDKPTIAFDVNDMTCGRSAYKVTRAIMAADNGAKVRVDIDARRVEVKPNKLLAIELGRVIYEAGYTPALHELSPDSVSDKAGGISPPPPRSRPQPAARRRTAHSNG